jgi:hypothetical protein
MKTATFPNPKIYSTNFLQLENKGEFIRKDTKQTKKLLCVHSDRARRKKVDEETKTLNPFPCQFSSFFFDGPSSRLNPFIPS